MDTKVERAHPVDRGRMSGVSSGLLASFLLGWAPILGKFAYRANVAPLTLAALRTMVAAIFLWIVYLLFWRRRIILRWSAALNCLLVGMFNGIGSLFYYSGLSRLDASRASLLGALYPVWVMLFLSASGQTIRRLTLLRLAISLAGAVLVTSPWMMSSLTDYLGVMLMLAYAGLNGWYLVMGQWVLADVPSQSGALYILTGMAATVALARIIGGGVVLPISTAGWGAIVALGLTTALSRLAMFFSLEKLGGVQTAILNLTELAVSLTLAFIFLGDRLAWYQWVGAILLLGGGLFARLDVGGGAAPPPSFNPMDS
ncbi:MAG TPA: DMT family transporter [Anaerolineae bacterium]|nr:DMT family transporter [Anaerolineae bacterium]HQI83776.1 DMT family transporter [Anaerolineae bacterium]